VVLLTLVACGRGERPATDTTETAVTETMTDTATTVPATSTMPVETPSAIAARTEANVPVEGLVLWLAADALVENGPENTVALWRSPNNMRASQDRDGNRPRVYPNAIGGKPAIRFDGDDDFLETNLNIDPTSMPNVTVVTVFNSRTNETDPHRKVYGADDGDFDRAAGLDDRATEGMNYVIFGGAGNGVIPYFRLEANQTYLTVDQYTPEHFNGWVNGQKKIDSHPVDHGRHLPHLYLGATGTAFPEYWAGDIAEVMVYLRPLIDEERRRVEDYLAVKYGVSLARAH
jgi:hypothetical protein